MTHQAAARATPLEHHFPRSFPFSAWAVPLMVVGQFAFLAVIPVVTMLVATVRDDRVRPLRRWVWALSATYAAPLAIWALRPDRAPSLSKDISPVFVGLIVGASGVLIYKISRLRGHRSAAK